MKKFLIAGLGNIGDEYADTRHNIGFSIADALAAALQKDIPSSPPEKIFQSDRLAFKAEAKFKGKSVVIIKPTTYMNLSGKAVNYWMQAEKIPAENLLVVTDDLALPFGTLRLKKKGGSGGHNGLGDIILTLGSEEYPRLRFGIGNNFSRGKQVDYVLSRWTPEELRHLPERIEEAVGIIKSFMSVGIEKTMTDFNSK